MSTAHAGGSQETLWEACGRLSVKTPKLIGHGTPAVLHRGVKNTLTLDMNYDPTGNVWLALLATVVIVVIGIVLTGFSGSAVGAIGGGGIVLSYTLIRLYRQREITIDLGAATQVIVDDKQRTIAFLTAIAKKTRWVVLEFKDGFFEANDAVHDIMAGNCRTAQISKVDRTFLVVILVIILLFVGAFGFCLLMGTIFVSPTN